MKLARDDRGRFIVLDFVRIAGYTAPGGGVCG